MSEAPTLAGVRRGLEAAPCPAAIVLALSFLGFGAFARDQGLALWQLVLLCVTTWALPSKVIFIASLASGAGLLATASAVALSAVRLMPMTFALMPYLASEGLKRRWLILVTHFVAVTAYVEGLIRLPKMAPSERASFFLGFGIGVMTLATTAAVIGFTVAGDLPRPIAIALVFMTPMYFLCGMMLTAGDPLEAVALALGFVLGPVFALILPDVSLVAAGLVGGSAAYALRVLVRRLR